MLKTTYLKPRLSEKIYSQSKEKNVFVFEVPREVNKHTIADAVAAQFDVTVIEVNTLNYKGKPKRTVVKGGRVVKKGKRSDIKKAYVTLKDGDTLPFFAAEDAEAEKAEKASEKAKKSKAKAEKEKEK